jgi:hypothetical protein
MHVVDEAPSEDIGRIQALVGTKCQALIQQVIGRHQGTVE